MLSYSAKVYMNINQQIRLNKFIWVNSHGTYTCSDAINNNDNDKKNKPC